MSKQRYMMRECIDCCSLLIVGTEIHGWRCPSCHQAYMQRREKDWIDSFVPDSELDDWAKRAGYVGLLELDEEGR